MPWSITVCRLAVFAFLPDVDHGWRVHASGQLQRRHLVKSSNGKETSVLEPKAKAAQQLNKKVRRETPNEEVGHVKAIAEPSPKELLQAFTQFATGPLVSKRKPTHARLHATAWGKRRQSRSHGMLRHSKQGDRQQTAIRIPSLLAARHPPIVSIFPAPPFAPPSADGLLSKVAELVLRSRLTKVESVSVAVDSTPLEMLSGLVRGVTVQGKGWCTPLRLSCDALDVRVGRTEIDLQKLLKSQRIFMKTPARGTATMTFTASDWKDFLAHPLTKDALGKYSVQTPVEPLVQFKSNGRVLFEPSSTAASSGLVVFPVSWGAYHFDVALGQNGSGPFITAKLDESTAGRMTAAERKDVRKVEAWVARFFETLLLDLDGCALSFRSMKVTTGKARSGPLLSLDLDVCVTRFPSLDINF